MLSNWSHTQKKILICNIEKTYVSPRLTDRIKFRRNMEGMSEETNQKMAVEYSDMLTFIKSNREI